MKSKRQHESLTKNGGDSSKRKRKSSCDNSPFENALYHWLKEKRSLGEPISGPLLKGKAKQFYAQIYGEDKPFNASDGWFDKFKERLGIKFYGNKRFDYKNMLI